MCGRYSLTHNEQEIQERFQVDSFCHTHLTPRFNIAPSQGVPVVVFANNRRELGLFTWGLIPSWTKDLHKAKPLINARAETLADKPSFKRALASRRCIIPADGFYEWQKTTSGKLPMRIRLKSDELFGLAGLWEEWRGPDGHTVQTCTIITVVANSLLAGIHDRMPAILPPDMESTWLNPTMHDASKLLTLLMPYPDNQLEAYPVSRLINSASVESPECIAPTLDS